MVLESEPLPLPGFRGCAATHDEYVYWVRGTVEDREVGELIVTNEVYRAKGKVQLSIYAKMVAMRACTLTPLLLPLRHPRAVATSGRYWVVCFFFGGLCVRYAKRLNAFAANHCCRILHVL